MSMINTEDNKKNKDIITRFCKIHNFNSYHVKLALTIICALILICIGGFLFYPKGDETDIKSRTVNFGLKDIGELATQIGYFTNVQVIRDSRTVNGLSVPFTEKQQIFSYDGEIRVGVDFDKIQVDENNDNKTITITLPHARILEKNLIEDSYESYDEKNNIFNPINPDDLVLSRQKLLEEAEQKAKSNGIIEKADQNAKVLIEGFLKSIYDLDEYKVIFTYIESENKEE